MTNNKILYGLAIVAGGGIAVWAGLPPLFLLVLACPIAMMFMMSGMGGMHGGHDDRSPSSDEEQNAPKSPHYGHLDGHLDGSHDRVDRP